MPKILLKFHLVLIFLIITACVSINKTLFSFNFNITPHTLEFSLVREFDVWQSTHGSWSDNYLRFNCYSFVLGFSDKNRVPGYFFAGYINLEVDVSNFTASTRIKNDLLYLGYTNVEIQNFNNLDMSRYGIIAFRRGWGNDFHVMRFNHIYNVWDHKPGQSAPLRFIVEPELVYWTNEGSIRGTVWNFHDLRVDNRPAIMYQSEIYYIVFDKAYYDGCECVFILIPNGIHNFFFTHLMECKICFLSIIEICSIPFGSNHRMCYWCGQRLSDLGGYRVFNEPLLPMKINKGEHYA